MSDGLSDKFHIFCSIYHFQKYKILISFGNHINCVQMFPAKTRKTFSTVYLVS